MEARVGYLREAELDPIRYLTQDAWGLLDRSRGLLGRMVDAPASDLVFVSNVTQGVAAVFANLPLEAGDEILANTHEYPACLAIVREAARRAGAAVVAPALPFPVGGEDEIVEALVSAVTARTRYCLVSHVTSSSGMILPVARIVAEMRERGVETVVDGAHAPGFCAVDIERIGPAFYVANCHKWLCCPRSCGFLYVRPDLQGGFRPLALSVHVEKGRPDRSFFQTEFDYMGTQDQSAAFCVADAIEAVPRFIDSDWEGVRAHNHAMAVRAREMLCRRLGVGEAAPRAMIGSMATIALPEHGAGRMERLAGRPTRYHDALQDRLLERHGIQVPVWSVRGGATATRVFRISCQLYNSLGQYEYLAGALEEELEIERGL
jgi:isopenicillin-N epimerase